MLELGRYRRPKMPHFERICTTCNSEVEDEIHFILRCPALVNTRRPRAPLLDKCFELHEDFQTCIKHNHAPNGKKMVIGVQLVTASQVQVIGCRWQVLMCVAVTALGNMESDLSSHGE